MTGEITLRGKVLPVGGIKEKVLAARRAGIKTIILPRRNEHDLDDIPAELRGEMTMHFVDTVDEVLGVCAAQRRRSGNLGGNTLRAHRAELSGQMCDVSGAAAKPAALFLD